jgi:1-pyrroline-5-carboxylate dehydrogenase
MWGDVTARAAAELRRPEIEDHFARLIQRTSPKSYAQVRAPATVCNQAERSAFKTAT